MQCVVAVFGNGIRSPSSVLSLSLQVGRVEVKTKLSPSPDGGSRSEGKATGEWQPSLADSGSVLTAARPIRFHPTHCHRSSLRLRAWIWLFPENSHCTCTNPDANHLSLSPLTFFVHLRGIPSFQALNRLIEYYVVAKHNSFISQRVVF